MSLNENQIVQLLDYSEIDESTPISEKKYPFDPKLRDSIPNSITSNFDDFWSMILQELDSMLKDLYSEDPLEILELIEI